MVMRTSGAIMPKHTPEGAPYLDSLAPYCEYLYLNDRTGASLRVWDMRPNGGRVPFAGVPDNDWSLRYATEPTPERWRELRVGVDSVFIELSNARAYAMAAERLESMKVERPDLFDAMHKVVGPAVLASAAKMLLDLQFPARVTFSEAMRTVLSSNPPGPGTELFDYFDRDGVAITREQWQRLDVDQDYGRVLHDVVQPPGIAFAFEVTTRWLGTRPKPGVTIEGAMGLFQQGLRVVHVCDWPACPKTNYITVAMPDTLEAARKSQEDGIQRMTTNVAAQALEILRGMEVVMKRMGYEHPPRGQMDHLERLFADGWNEISSRF